MLSQSILNNAILSMHAYNIASGTHINSSILEDYNTTGTKIGLFDLINFKDEYATGFVAGYFESASESILSFRGTNINGLLADIANGWTIGLGVASSPVGQAADAINYYNELAGDTSGIRSNSGAIATTGHSLGGGLAGYIAAAYHLDGTLFNYMPFANALGEDLSSNNPLLGSAPGSADFNGISAVNTYGEVLTPFRTDPLDPISPTVLSSHAGFPTDPRDLHSAALQVALIWSDLNAERPWEDAGSYIWDAFFDADLAQQNSKAVEAVGADGSPSTVMAEAIAYSAIAEGAKPFGDTAIHAMFDDAADLNLALNALTIPASLTNAKEELGAIAVEFAGRLALERVYAATPTEAVDLANDHVVDASTLGGVLHLSSDNSVLTVEVGRGRWNIGDADTAASKRAELVSSIFDNADDRLEFEWFMSSYLYSNNASNYNIYDAIATVSMQIGAPNQYTAPDVSYAEPNGFNLVALNFNSLFVESVSDGQDDLFVGSIYGDKIRGKNDRDIIIGGQGDDVLLGGEGHDYISGGAGDDWIQSGQGTNEYLSGGEGNDTIFAQSSFQNVVGGAGNDTIVISALAGDASLQLEGSDTIMIAASSGTEREFYIEDGSDLTGGIVFNGRQLGQIKTYITDMEISNVGGVDTRSYFLGWSDENGTSFEKGTTQIYNEDWELVDEYETVVVEFGDGTTITINRFYDGAMGLTFEGITPDEARMSGEPNLEDILPYFSTFNDGIAQEFEGDTLSDESYIAWTTYGSTPMPEAFI